MSSAPSSAVPLETASANAVDGRPRGEENLVTEGASERSMNDETGTGLIDIDNMALETAKVACSGRVRRPMVAER